MKFDVTIGYEDKTKIVQVDIAEHGYGDLDVALMPINELEVLLLSLALGDTFWYKTELCKEDKAKYKNGVSIK